MILGDGVGMMVLKRLSDAERDGDKIYAVICGSGSSSDGRAKSIYAPSKEGQIRALNRAYEKLLDELFEDMALDVSSDISVLNTLLAQEGLTEDGLRKP